MDLSNLVNPTNSAPDHNPSQSSSPVAQRHSQSHAFPAPSPSYPQHNSHQTTPQYAPPPQEHRSPSGSLNYHGKAATPLQTPSHYASGQYPFPQNPSQSPVATHPGQQYPPYSAHPSAAPGSRPTSHGMAQQQQQQQQQQPSSSHLPQSAGFQQYSSSHSPTPPSQLNHTPHSVRQSPHATFAHPPQPPQAQQYSYQHSQPSTPLGPPSLQYQRTSGHGSHPEILSPNHQRHFSGASNGMVAGSPAQHHPSVGNLIESPGAYSRHSPQLRRTSDYLSQGERDRSESVSPKTRVVPRLPSHSSRQSSVNEAYGSRASIASNGQMPQDAQSHMPSPIAGRHMGVAQPSFAQSASNVSQMASRTPQMSHSDVSIQPAPQNPLSQNAAPPQHRSQKMGMNNLLTPAREHDQQDRNEVMARNKSVDPFASPIEARAESPEQRMGMKQEHGSHSLLQQPVQPAATAQRPANPLKREASEQPASEPPMKREKKRKYAQRPIWAAIAHGNPKFDGTNGNNGQNGKPRRQQQQQQQPRQQPPPRTTPHPAPMSQPRHHPNGATPSNGAPVDYGAPWTQPQPLDMDLVNARAILGPWEKTFKWNTPLPALLRVVQDWLWQQLEQHSDIGQDPRTGTIEIEAKIGTLIRSGENDRAQGPYLNTGVIHPAHNKQYRFESRMEEPEHKAMNQFLNATLQASHVPGRVPIIYEHLYQTDTFATLSPAGLAALPASVQKRPVGRDLRLRTSRNTKTNEIVAHIVKVPLGDLHIQNPCDPYDCRISMNLEVNFPPDVDISELIEPPSHDRPSPPERRKDRLSYKHLAYSIDLTKVESHGVPSKYELELEVDANVLRQQIERGKRGLDTAYVDVVSGFLDNATFLMRQAP